MSRVKIFWSITIATRKGLSRVCIFQNISTATPSHQLLRGLIGPHFKNKYTQRSYLHRAHLLCKLLEMSFKARKTQVTFAILYARVVSMLLCDDRHTRCLALATKISFRIMLNSQMRLTYSQTHKIHVFDLVYIIHLGYMVWNIWVVRK